MHIRGQMPPVWQGGLIVLLVFLAYLPALPGGFVWDDDSWTTNLTPLFQNASGLRSIWFQPTALQQYYPLSATTFWLDYQLWNVWTPPYHVENVLLHALAALLFWRLLLRLQLPGAWLAAALFALHPVMAESAAWITERKNVLSLALYLGAFLAYWRYAQGVTGDRPSPDFRLRQAPARQVGAASGPYASRFTGHSSRATCHVSLFYGLAFVLFTCALLAKTTAFSLPAAILLIGWWKRGQIRWRADVLPTLPFFALALGLCAVTAWLEYHACAQDPDFDLTFPQRCLIAGHAFWFYLSKLFWPANLCFVYPRWQPDPGAVWQWLYPATALGMLFTLWQARRRLGRGPVTALLFYVGTLFPVLGFLNAYGMRYSFVWDHWVYLSSLGIIALAAVLVARTAEVLRKPAVAYGFAAIVLPVFAVLTWRQAGMYKDVETLWRQTLIRNPGCWMAHYNLGNYLAKQGHLEEAAEHYHSAIRMNPNSPDAPYNLGRVLAAEGRLDEAIENYRRAIQIDPNCFDALNNLGTALAAKGRFEEAIESFRQAIQINPNLYYALDNLGLVLANRGRFDEAIKNFHQAVQTNPNYPEAQYHLGNALAARGRWEEAIASYRQAIRIKPDYSDALNRLGTALASRGRFDEAIENFRQVIRINPNNHAALNNLGIALAAQGRFEEAIENFRRVLQTDANDCETLNNLAWALATGPKAEFRNGAEAVRLAEHACELTHYDQPAYLGTLAAAYAESGRFPEAVATAEKAEQLASTAGAKQPVRQLLELYRAGKPYREPAAH